MNKCIGVYLHRYALHMLLLMLMAMPLTIQAQVLSLNEAIGKAVSNYPLLKQRMDQVEAAKAHVQSVNDNRLPSFNLQEQLTLGTNNAVDGAYFGMGIVPSTTGGVGNDNVWQANSGNVATAFLQWNFYNFGYYNALVGQAKSAWAASRSQLDRDKYLLTMQVIGIYLDLLKKARLLEVEKENVERVGAVLTAIRATAAGGLRPGVDSVTEGAAYAQAKIDYLQASNDYSSVKVALSVITGLDTLHMEPDTTLIERISRNAPGLADSGPSVAEPPGIGPSVADPPGAGPSGARPSGARPPGVWGADTISDAHPLLNVYHQQYLATLAQNKSISRQYLPKVGLEAAGWSRSSSIDASGAYGNLTDGWGYQRQNYLFGLSVTYNLFDLKKRKDQLREGDYQAKASEEALAEQRLQLDKMFRQTEVAYLSVLAKLKELEVQRESAAQAYQQQVALYSGGLTTLLDVTNALYVLHGAEINFVVNQDELSQILCTRAGLDNHLDEFVQQLK
jgi:outer membrane protein, adhesin transport system